MRAYFKYTISSVVSTLVDYAVTIGLTELGALPYLGSSVLGLISGGVTNYHVNRNWVFGCRTVADRRQPAFYLLFWILNLLINTLGLYSLTEGLALDYRISKIITSVIVGMVVNYQAQRLVVFRGR
jgi:putative flippase GtrA